MNSGIYSATSGLIAMERALEITSNNLANMNTSGFKQDIPFYAHLTKMEKQFNNNDIKHIINSGVEIRERIIDFSQGSFMHTSNPLDLAIEGKGFFQVAGNEKNYYTRDGSFTINKDQMLVTKNNELVLGLNGPISITIDDIRIDEEGQIFDSDNNLIDQLIIRDFQENDLAKFQNNLYLPYNEENEGIEPDNIRIRQGFLEASNVNPISSMVELIKINNLSQTYQKVIQSISEDMDKRMISEITR